MLDLIDADRVHADDRDRIDTAVRAVARANAGVVSTNAVRAHLTNAWGLTVTPQCIGPRLRALTLAGVLEVTGWEINEDQAGRNAGKPLLLRRWVGEL